MRERTAAEIEAKLKELWPDVDKREVSASGGSWFLRLVSMYEAPGLGAKHILALCEFFDTTHVDDFNREGSGGCETCDYGSQYGFTLKVS